MRCFVSVRRHVCFPGPTSPAKALLVSLALGALAGCSAAPQDTRAAYEPVTDVSETRSALAELPPAAGEVAAVLQNRTRGVLTQRIVLRGDPGAFGESAIVVKVDQGPRRPLDVEGPVAAPNKATIATELDETFAGLDMGLSETFARNSFGPFGYAVGHPNARVTCIYAWQWGLAKPQKLGDPPDAGASMPSEPTSVRVRLCRSSLSETEMVALLRNLQVFSPNSHAAYLDPDYAGAGETQGGALAAAGVGYFVGPNVMRVALHDKPKHAHKHRRRKVARHSEPIETMREGRAALVAPAPGSIAVPLPNGPQPANAPAAANPLLAPLATNAAAPPARRDDMPLPPPAAAPKPAAPLASAASIPLPN
jgi:hypothetical protein